MFLPSPTHKISKSPAQFAVRLLAISAVSALLAACATGPKIVRSSSNLAIQSVSVSAQAGPASFANMIENIASRRLLVDGVGNRADRAVTVKRLRYKGAGSSFFVSNSHSASVDVVLKSTTSGAVLRNFSLSARSFANYREDGRTEMAQSIANQLSRIFPQRPRPIVSQPRLTKKTKPKTKPTTKPKVAPKPSAKPAVSKNEFPQRDEPAVIQVNVQPQPSIVEEKPKLLPVAVAKPETAAEPTQVDETPAEPQVKITPAPPIPANPPVAEVKPEVEAAAAPVEDELCVVTLENDCSGNQ